MCGITGFFNRDGEPASPIILQKMMDMIAHRGPDGEGSYTQGAIGLGHRRLAIIDLSPAGHQPMLSLDGKFIIIYNGETYNFQELRLELEARGHQFRSRTDTEVVLAAYMEWSEKVLDHLNGMFAFAIWDWTRQELFLARDRYGIKPLYYTQQGSAFLFGSEVKTFLPHPSFRTALDKEALFEYFTFQNIFSQRTLFKDVRLLPAGSYLRVPLGNKGPGHPVSYWDYSFVEPEKAEDERVYLEELDRLLRQAVQRQLISDVGVGAYLSGGMDSGTVTAITASQIPNLKSFTCGFDLHSASGMELAFDERQKAELMSYRFKTEHYEIVLKAGDMERVMPALTWHLEDPRVGQSYPNYYVAQLTSKFVKVALSGTGGDEMFGGYPWRYYRAVVNSNFEDYVNKYYAYWQRLVPQHILSDFFKPIWSNVSHVSTREIFRNVFGPREDYLERPEDYINQSLYFEAKTFLHGLLVVDDKLSMAHGLETRVPFLDNDLVDFAMRLPVHLKLANLGEVVRLNENDAGPKSSVYFQRTKDGKQLLRRVMARYVPAEVVDGEKQGFSAPDASWFKGESMKYVRNEILNKKARLFEYLDFKTVSGMVEEHLVGQQNRRLLIWSLLNVEWWLRKFEGEVSSH